MSNNKPSAVKAASQPVKATAPTTSQATTLANSVRLSPLRDGFMDSVFKQKTQGVSLVDGNESEDAWDPTGDIRRPRSSSGNSGSYESDASSAASIADSEFYSSSPIPAGKHTSPSSSQSLDPLFPADSMPLPATPSISFPDRAGALLLCSLAGAVPQTHQGISKICHNLLGKLKSCFM